MERRRTDIAAGLMLSVVAHGAILAAAGGMLSSRNTAPISNDPLSPLEVLVVEEQGWRAQLEDSQPLRTAQPRELPKLHKASPPPDWPELEVANETEQPLSLRVPSRRRSIEAPLPDAAEPRELIRPESPREAMREPEAAPVPVTSASSLVLYRPDLRYPSRPRSRGIEGLVRIAIEVGPDGEVSRAWLLKSSGNRALDRAALANLRAWRFDADAVERAGLGRLFRNDVRFEID